MKTITHPVTGKAIPEYATGVIVPVFTPALEGGILDPEGYAAYAELLASNPDITSLFVRCGSGQMYTYTREETKQVIDITMDRVGDAKYTLFGTFGIYGGDPNQRPDRKQYIDETIELSLYAQEKGATGVVMLVPWAIVPEAGESMEDMQFDYFKAVSDAVDIPILIYNTPNMPEEYNLTGPLVERIKHLPNVAAAKISTANLAWIADLEIASEGTDFAIIAGHEGVYLPCLSVGTLGVIGQGCNIYPSILTAVMNSFLEGDVAGAWGAQRDVNLALRNFQGYGNSTSGLAFMKSKGLDIQDWDKSGAPLRTPEEVRLIRQGLDPILEKYETPVA